MAKAKKSKLNKYTSKPYSKYSTQKRHPKVSSQQATKTTKHPKPLPPTIPFSPTDRILLVGEGDFSFSHSLLAAHNCSSLIATCYDNASVVTSKYTHATPYIRPLEAEEGCKVIYGVDATKLGRSGAPNGGGKEVKKGGFDKVVFNFPHVGGLTKDVNRQVRANQGEEHLSHSKRQQADDDIQSFLWASSILWSHCWHPRGPSLLQFSKASRTICGISEILHVMSG